MKSPFKSERKFNQWLVEQYFLYGSVDEVLRRHRYDIPISYAGYQRVLDRWGVVKTAGPNSKLTEILSFLTKLVEENVSFEYLYKNMPPNFRASTATIYRILGYIKEGITRRIATGLILTPHRNQNLVLVGEDVSTPRLELGKPFGSVSIPMGFSRKRDIREDAILRILQQEVFTQFAIKGKIPEIIQTHPKPFMFLDIADVRVEIFHLPLPKKFSDTKHFFSYKLKNYKFISLKDKNTLERYQKNFRVGVSEALEGYKKYLGLKRRNLVFNPLQARSRLNYFLAEAPADPFR